MKTNTNNTNTRASELTEQWHSSTLTSSKQYEQNRTKPNQPENKSHERKKRRKKPPTQLDKFTFFDETLKKKNIEEKKTAENHFVCMIICKMNYDFSIISKSCMVHSACRVYASVHSLAGSFGTHSWAIFHLLFSYLIVLCVVFLCDTHKYIAHSIFRLRFFCVGCVQCLAHEEKDD